MMYSRVTILWQPIWMSEKEVLLYSSLEHSEARGSGYIAMKKREDAQEPKLLLHQVCYWNDFSLLHHTVCRKSCSLCILELLLQAASGFLSLSPKDTNHHPSYHPPSKQLKAQLKRV